MSRKVDECKPLQMGVNNTELWNNLGLCCFYASQYDMTLSCFERALALADDENMVRRCRLTLSNPS